MTARWVVDVVQPERDLNVIWQPISLMLKNDAKEGDSYYDEVWTTHRLLRVMEAVKAAEGNDAAFAFYWECGRQVHHDGNYQAAPAKILEAAGLDTSYADAFDDESWDQVIADGTAAGLATVGDNVGTPIIAFDTDDGKKGIFGPVISEVPTGEKGLAMWDAVATITTMDMFWELKRTRTEEPNFGERP